MFLIENIGLRMQQMQPFDVWYLKNFHTEGWGVPPPSFTPPRVQALSLWGFAPIFRLFHCQLLGALTIYYLSFCKQSFFENISNGPKVIKGKILLWQPSTYCYASIELITLSPETWCLKVLSSNSHFTPKLKKIIEQPFMQIILK